MNALDQNLIKSHVNIGLDFANFIKFEFAWITGLIYKLSRFIMTLVPRK